MILRPLLLRDDLAILTPNFMDVLFDISDDLAELDYDVQYKGDEQTSPVTRMMSWLDSDGRLSIYVHDLELVGLRFIEVGAQDEASLDAACGVVAGRVTLMDVEELVESVVGPAVVEPRRLVWAAVALRTERGSRLNVTVEQALRSPDADVRGHAAHAAGTLSTTALLPALQAAAAVEVDEAAERMMRAAIKLCSPAPDQQA